MHDPNHGVSVIFSFKTELLQDTTSEFINGLAVFPGNR